MKTEVREFCGKSAENGEICGREAIRKMSNKDLDERLRATKTAHKEQL